MCSIIPESMVFKHYVQYAKQLTHTSHHSYFVDFTSCNQALVKGLDLWIIPDGRNNRHIYCRTDNTSTAPDTSLASHSATIPVEWRHSTKRRGLFTVQLPQFRKIRKNGHGQVLAYTRHALKNIIFLFPFRTSFYHLFELFIDIIEFLFQPCYMRFYAFPYCRVGLVQTVFLRRTHRHDLPTAHHDYSQPSGLFSRQRARLGLYRGGITSDDFSIQSIRFGQYAYRTGKITNMAGVYDCYRKTHGLQFRRTRDLVAG